MFVHAARNVVLFLLFPQIYKAPSPILHGVVVVGWTVVEQSFTDSAPFAVRVTLPLGIVKEVEEPLGVLMLPEFTVQEEKL